MSSWKEPNLKFCQHVYISVGWWSTILILFVYEWECLMDQPDAKIFVCASSKSFFILQYELCLLSPSVSLFGYGWEGCKMRGVVTAHVATSGKRNDRASFIWRLHIRVGRGVPHRPHARSTRGKHVKLNENADLEIADVLCKWPLTLQESRL